MSARIDITTITPLKAAPVLDQPLTEPLPARSGTKIVTPEWLLSLPKLDTDYPKLSWLDESHILYASPPMENKSKSTIELLNANTGEHKVLGEGSNPNPSPAGQWIAFTHGEKEAKQLWIMGHNGSNLKQLSHVQGGLGDYINYNFDFAW